MSPSRQNRFYIRSGFWNDRLLLGQFSKWDCISDPFFEPTPEDIEVALKQLKCSPGFRNHVVRGDLVSSFDEQGPQPVHLPKPEPANLMLAPESEAKKFYQESFRGKKTEAWYNRQRSKRRSLAERSLAWFLTYPVGVWILDQMAKKFISDFTFTSPRSNPEPVPDSDPGPVTWTYLDLETG